ncbi:MAG: zinc ribbon domain-containing protein [Dehalococcoidales bacterium]|nr:zinc ribbon domain-containing protein [Dehalococcoidales bacterium]
MPIYEYECMECGEKFEKFCRLNEDKDTEKKLTCPKCTSEKVTRVYSTFGTASSSCGSSQENHSFG